MKKKIAIIVFMFSCVVGVGLFCFTRVQAKTNSYTVVFYANNGKGNMSKQKIKYNKLVKLSECQFYRKGYVFQGWAKSKKGKVVYLNRQYVKKLAKSGKVIKLYAKWKKAGKRRALVLGETSTQQVSMLDVTSMEAFFRSNKFYGKSMDEVVAYPNHIKEDITNKIIEVFNDTVKDDVSYIYITCHGEKETGNIKLGSDDSYFEPAEFRELCNNNIKGNVIIMLDCCYAGNLITKSSVQEENFEKEFINNFLCEEENYKDDLSKKFKILCSSERFEKSEGGETISRATTYWQKGAGWIGVSGKKSKLIADSNGDKKITLNELYEYSYSNVEFVSDGQQHITVYPEKSDYVIFGRFNK